MNENDVKMETEKHIARVKQILRTVTDTLTHRGMVHDRSKFSDEEFPYFVEYTPKLKDCTYGSDEYKQYLKKLQPALDHHYAKNKHHPEHHKNGIKDMNLIDIIEMFCDWLAATERHADGDIYKSIEHNKNRFKYGEELESIFNNTAKELKKEN